MTHPNLLLVSSSGYRDAGFLVNSLPAVKAFMPDDLEELLFIPFANVAREFDAYEAKMAAALEGLNFNVKSIHHADDPVAAVQSAKAIAVGGGNTFALLLRLQEAGLIEPIRQAVQGGAHYVGWSAGSNLACPTMRTTNDMPICQPLSFETLDLVPFQINAHFVSGKLANHNGESREDRLVEFLSLNLDESVLALPEGVAFLSQGEQTTLCGEADGFLFTRGARQTLKRGEDLSWLLTRDKKQ